MENATLSIGELARATGTKVQTVRYYEQIGLMPEPARTSGNQRRYGPGHLSRLAFVRHGRELGFTLEAIRELLGLCDNPGQPCALADRIAQAHLREVESRISRLKALRSELKHMIEQCAGGEIESCRIIEVLSDHALCQTGDHATADPPA